MNKDLTVGNPRSVLWKFCLPLFGSIIFQQLYNIADSLVAGRYIGANALAAVGNSYEITLVYIAFAFGCNIGCSVVVSNLFGAKKYKDLKTAVYTTFIAGGALCLILMIFGFIFSPALLGMIDTPEQLFEDSLLYLNIYTGGLLFLFFYNICTGIFSALGDSKTPFIFLAFSSTSNVFVDILFVKVFEMGISGVAWATFLCQGISCILALITIYFRLRAIETKGRPPFFSWAILKKIAIIAIPSILQQSFISVGNIIIQRIINGFGESVMAGYSAGIKLNNLVITSFTTLGNGMSNFTAQNIGAGKRDRIPKGHSGGLMMAYLICVPVILLYMLCPDTLVGIFMKSGTDHAGDAIKAGRQLLMIVSPFYVIAATKLITDGILRGAGLMKLFMSATFTDLLLRVVLAYVFSRQFGVIGIWWAWPVGWIVATVMSVMFYTIALQRNQRDI